MHTWSKIRYKLEHEYLAESLRGRLTYFVTAYHATHDKDEGRAQTTAERIAVIGRNLSFSREDGKLQIIGPADAQIAKLKDVYRKAVYAKAADHGILADYKDEVEADRASRQDFYSRVDFNFDP